MSPGDADLIAHVDSHATLRAVAGCAVDGFRFYGYLRGGPSRHAWDGIVVAEADKEPIDDAAAEFMAWAEALFEQPGSEGAWDASRLEHDSRSGCRSPRATARSPRRNTPAAARLARVLGGRGNVGRRRTGPPRAHGDPAARAVRRDAAPRWWAFEDGHTNFGDIRASDTTDLARLLLIEFGLVYGNDWFILPCDLEHGSVARIERITVTNVFGERVLVEAAGARGGVAGAGGPRERRADRLPGDVADARALDPVPGLPRAR